MNRYVVLISNFLVLLLLLLSCAEDNKYTVVNLSDKEKVLSNDKWIESIEFVHLEEDSLSLIGHIASIKESEDYWYVLDNRSNHKVVAFDKKGNYKCCYNKQGQGPGEYLAIYSMDVNPSNGNVYLLCPLKILVLDKNLNFANEISLPEVHYYRLAYHEDGLFLLAMNDTYIDYLSLSDNSLKRVSIIDGDKHDVPGPAPYFIKSDNKLFFHIESSDKVYKLSKEGLIPLLTLDYDYKKEANKYYKKNIGNDLDPEKRIKYARPILYSIVAEDDSIKSFIYSQFFFSICFNDSDKNYPLLIPAQNSMYYNNGSIISWMYAYEYNPDSFNQHHLYDNIKVNHLDWTIELQDSGNPIICIYKLKTE